MDNNSLQICVEHHKAKVICNGYTLLYFLMLLELKTNIMNGRFHCYQAHDLVSVQIRANYYFNIDNCSVKTKQTNKPEAQPCFFRS